MTSYGSFFGCGSFAAPGPFMDEVTPERHTTSDGTCNDQTTVSPDKAFKAYWTYNPGLNVDADGNFITQSFPQGITMSGAVNWIGSVLNDSRGWARANVRFVFLDPDRADDIHQNTSYRYTPMDDTDCAGSTGCFHCFTAGGVQGVVLLSAESFGFDGYLRGGIVTHEAGHAFFGGEHNEDPTSIMKHEVPVEWPSDGDIDDLKAWLGI